MDRNPRGAAALAALMAQSTQRAPAQPYAAPIIQTQKRVKVGRNDKCPCGSGKKYKKCCLQRLQGRGATVVRKRDPAKLPREKPSLSGATVDAAASSTKAPDGKNATAMAMLNAKVNPRIVWAYLETGLYITEINRNAHPPENIEKWEAALTQYDEATEEERQILLAPALADE